jgi:aromatic ring-opening dioxygenase catalytic subunit (LigB family)
MAQIVSVIALAHAPGATGWLDKAPPEEQKDLVEGYASMSERLRAARPDVIVGIANDHLLNFPMNNIPDWCVGTSERWSGPSEWFRDWINVPDYEVAGQRDLARTIVRKSGERGINLAFSDTLEFDDNWSVPLKFLTPDCSVPLVPIHMNCVVPPMPAPGRCLDFGRVLAEVIGEWPEHKRVAIMATGGLSHDPGGPKYFAVDEVFDRWFLELLGSGDTQRVRRELSIEKMMGAGDGGTVELLAWLVAMGAADTLSPGLGSETMFYVPSVALRCGMGGVDWKVPN